MQIERAERWSTPVPLADFVESTGLERFPGALADRLSGPESSPVLELACNGLIDYRLHEVSVRQRVVWRVRAPAGGSDVHTFTARGTGCTLTVGQHHEPETAQDHKGGQELHLAPVDPHEWPRRLARRVENYQEVFPGLTARLTGDGHRLLIPPELATPHEPSFTAVLDEFLDRVESGRWSGSSARTVQDRYDLLARAQHLAGQDTT